MDTPWGGAISVTSHATLLAPNLTTLDTVGVTLDGTGTIFTNQWTSLTNGGLTITGGQYTFPGLTDIDSSSLYVQDGGILALTAVTSYAKPQSNLDAYWIATGPRSTLSLPGLSGLGSVANYHNGLWVQASQGGHVGLPRLPAIGGASQAVAFQSDGTGSRDRSSGVAQRHVAMGRLGATNYGKVALRLQGCQLDGIAVTIAASSSVSGDLTLGGTSTLTGSGTFVGDLTNSGTITPGNSPGIFTVQGNYVQTAAGTIEYPDRRDARRVAVRRTEGDRQCRLEWNVECVDLLRLRSRPRQPVYAGGGWRGERRVQRLQRPDDQQPGRVAAQLLPRPRPVDGRAIPAGARGHPP